MYRTQNDQLISHFVYTKNNFITEEVAMERFHIKNLRARINELRQLGFKEIITRKNSENKTEYGISCV